MQHELVPTNACASFHMNMLVIFFNDGNTRDLIQQYHAGKVLREKDIGPST